MKVNRFFPILFLLTLSLTNGFCQQKFEIRITPHHDDWTYQLGENVQFQVTITEEIPSNNTFSVKYEIGTEKMLPTITEEIQVKSGMIAIDGGTMNTAGFLRCKVTVSNGKGVYTEIATAAFEPELIKPTAVLPNDFESFWDELKLKHEVIPLDLKLTPIKSKSNERVTYYHIDYQNFEFKNRSYGILSVPKEEGSYPAVIRFPGAGIYPLGGNTNIADKGVITLDLYIHPFPANMDNDFYSQLGNTSLLNYMFFGTHDKYAFYYRRVISGCLRAVDAIYSLPQFDGRNLAAWGSSQGGALSIITTALDKRIKMLVALCPAMCDYTGYLNGRAGGWPHFFNQDNREMYENSHTIHTLSYYDVVNFARFITVPGFYSWGFNDETTPPTSFYSAYNVIKASKHVHIVRKGNLEIYPEQIDKTYQWILESFKKE